MARSSSSSKEVDLEKIPLASKKQQNPLRTIQFLKYKGVSEQMSLNTSSNSQHKNKTLQDLKQSINKKLNNQYSTPNTCTYLAPDLSFKNYEDKKQQVKTLFFMKQHGPSHKGYCDSREIANDSSSFDPRDARDRPENQEQINIQKYMNEFCLQPVVSLKKQKENKREDAVKISTALVHQTSLTSKKSATHTKNSAIMTQNTLRLSSSDKKSPNTEATDIWESRPQQLSNPNTSDRSLADFDIRSDLKYEPQIKIDQLNLFKMRPPSPQIARVKPQETTEQEIHIKSKCA